MILFEISDNHKGFIDNDKVYEYKDNTEKIYPLNRLNEPIFKQASFKQAGNKNKSYFWDYEYIPELADTAIPRHLQEQAYDSWSKKPNKENMNNLIRTFGKLITSEINKYQGTLDRDVLHNYAKKYVADSVKSFKPETKNQLSTHIVNNLQRLHRLNYRNVQALRAPEDVQAKLNDYVLAKDELENRLGRPPEESEIAKEMGISDKSLKNMYQFMKFEQGPMDMNLGIMQSETSPEENALDLVYHDLSDQHKTILEHKTGYNGAKILTGKQIAKKLKISPVRVTQISDSIGKKIMDLLYGSTKT